MINQEIKIEKKETMEYEILPENIYQIELLDINIKSNETYDSKQGKTDKKEYEDILDFQYTLLAGKDKGGESLRGRNIWDNFIPTYLYISTKNGKNKLYRIIESLLGRDITPDEEAEGINSEFLNSLIGRQMRISTKNVRKGDKVFSKIDSYNRIDEELDALTDEEKEKATVKKKNDDDDPDFKKALPEDEINASDIPF